MEQLKYELKEAIKRNDAAEIKRLTDKIEKLKKEMENDEREIKEIEWEEPDDSTGSDFSEVLKQREKDKYLDGSYPPLYVYEKVVELLKKMNAHPMHATPEQNRKRPSIPGNIGVLESQPDHKRPAPGSSTTSS